MCCSELNTDVGVGCLMVCIQNFNKQPFLVVLCPCFSDKSDFVPSYAVRKKGKGGRKY